MPAYPSNKSVVAELVQVEVNCFSGNVSHSCIRGSVFDNGVIRHELNGAGEEEDCTTISNVYVWTQATNGLALLN